MIHSRQFKFISPTELGDKINQHTRFLQGDPNGACANFAHYDLTCQDFSQCDLRFADFRGANLLKVKFCHARLQSICAIGADFRLADLSQADLSHATLSGASLRGAILLHSVCDQAIFRDADVMGVTAQFIQAHAADFSGACLIAADFRHASLIESNFSQCDLRGAICVAADMRQVCLDDAMLSRADFRECQMAGATGHAENLSEGNWQGASFAAQDFYRDDWRWLGHERGKERV